MNFAALVVLAFCPLASSDDVRVEYAIDNVAPFDALEDIQDSPIRLVNCSWFGNAPNCAGSCPYDFIQITSSSRPPQEDALLLQPGFGAVCGTGEKHYCCQAITENDAILEYVTDIETSMIEETDVKKLDERSKKSLGQGQDYGLALR